MAPKFTTIGLANKHSTGNAHLLYIEVGTGSQTESESLTSLQTPLSPRKAVGAATVVGNVLYLSAIFGNNEVNADLSEFGVYDALTGGDLQLYGVETTPFTKTSAAPYVKRIVVPLENKVVT